MEANQYEQHHYPDPNFPVIFHLDVYTRNHAFIPHWHQNPEILYFMEGDAEVSIDTEKLTVSKGSIVVIPVNALHYVIGLSETIKYYCLIADRNFCGSFGFDLDELCFKRLIRDPELNKKMENLIGEFQRQESYHKAQILSDIVSLFVYLTRNHLVQSPISLDTATFSRLEMVKQILPYIDKNYAQNLSLDMLANRAGFSKFYFCHAFKEITGITPVYYINFVRCKKAKELLCVKGCSVSEAAALCGFDSLSYFTKTYKKYNGNLPSDE